MTNAVVVLGVDTSPADTAVLVTDTPAVDGPARVRVEKGATYELSTDAIERDETTGALLWYPQVFVMTPQVDNVLGGVPFSRDRSIMVTPSTEELRFLLESGATDAHVWVTRVVVPREARSCGCAKCSDRGMGPIPSALPPPRGQGQSPCGCKG